MAPALYAFCECWPKPGQVNECPIFDEIGKAADVTDAERTAAIESNLGNPKSAEVDGTSAEQHPLPDQIEADRYLAAKEAMANASRGLRFTKVKHPGPA
jgi:hypothetical protein